MNKLNLSDLEPGIYESLKKWKDQQRKEQESNLGTDEHVPFDLWVVAKLNKQRIEYELLREHLADTYTAHEVVLRRIGRVA